MRQLESIPALGVLVVEDEYLIRLNTVDVIEEAGFRVYEASDADRAIQTLERRREIRVVFTDVHMPGSMNGLELARYVAAHWPEVKVIVTSGRALPTRTDIPPGGACISKPYSSSQLLGRLRTVVGDMSIVSDGSARPDPSGRRARGPSGKYPDHDSGWGREIARRPTVLAGER